MGALPCQLPERPVMSDQNRFEYEVMRELYEQEQELLRQDAGYRDFLDALEAELANTRLNEEQMKWLSM